MALNLLKLCVGCDSVEDLEEWISERLRRKRPDDKHAHGHVTRMVPTRGEELIDGGSLYWVIKGLVQCRQRILAIEPFTDTDGIGRCRVVLDPSVVRTEYQPRRAFQGWRYLRAEDAPADLGKGRKGLAEMPPKLRQELAALGLL